MTESTAAEIASRLQLVHHPEGGAYRETYRSTESTDAVHLPQRFDGARSFSTAIYYMLERGEFSSFHRIRQDELWHHYAGAALALHCLTPGAGYRSLQLGPLGSGPSEPQLVVPADCWFAAELVTDDPFALVGCTVAPGFDFADFELADRDTLAAEFPEKRDLIHRLTRV